MVEDMEKSVLDWLEKTVSLYPDKTAFESLGKSITFRELELQAKQIGSKICEYNTTNTPIAVVLDKEVTTVSAFLGVVYSGRAYAPIDITLPESRIEKILSCLKASIIITEAQYVEKLKSLCDKTGIQARIFVLSDMLGGEIREQKLSDNRRWMIETDPLYIIFTSGSSGIPKGVVTSHHSLMCYIDAFVGVMGIDDKDILGNQSPLDYIAAIRDIYIPLYKGASTVLIPKNYFMQMDKLADVVEANCITALGWSTSALSVIASLGLPNEQKFSSIKKVCFSGSIMHGGVLKKWQSMLPDALFVNQYGPTEATASCTYYVVDHMVEEDETIPIGIPYKNYKIILLKEDLSEAGVGEEGEICVGGPILALGYFNNLEKTHQDFIQNPLNNEFEERIYKTGDIGEIKADGLLYFHGRRDRQIKHMGHRVELDEIELAANSIPGIKESCTLYNSEEGAIWLFYSGDTQLKDLVKELRGRLPGFMVPRKVMQLEVLPKLPNGKTDMPTLKQMAGIIR